jgi:hypothetical protein
MTDTLLCPTCGTELMEHEAKQCLDQWVSCAVPMRRGNSVVRAWSSKPWPAWDLMQKVWEMNPNTSIEMDEISIRLNHSPQGLIIIHGPTFPVRVCRTAIYLAARRKEGT